MKLFSSWIKERSRIVNIIACLAQIVFESILLKDSRATFTFLCGRSQFRTDDSNP